LDLDDDPRKARREAEKARRRSGSTWDEVDDDGQRATRTYGSIQEYVEAKNGGGMPPGPTRPQWPPRLPSALLDSNPSNKERAHLGRFGVIAAGVGIFAAAAFGAATPVTPTAGRGRHDLTRRLHLDLAVE
jgi:hypothetical protein